MSSVPAVETLTGHVERVTFHNPDSGFAVLRVKAKGRRDLVTLVGHLPSAVAGEDVEATGRWVVDKDHGAQFRAESIHTTHPHSPAGIEKYLGSGLIKGIGPHFAKSLFESFGLQVFDVIEQFPSRLTEVRGIGPTRAERITTSWRDQRVIRDIMVFLQGHGLGTARAVRIYKTYNADAIGLVKQNPYRLATDIRGIGFKTADELAARLGIERNSPLRARAGIRYVLQRLTTEGHCYYPEDKLVQQAVDLLEIDATVITAALDHEIRERSLVRDAVTGEPARIYLNFLHYAECELATRLKRLQSGAHPLPSIDTQKALAWVEQKVGLQLAEAQRAAVAMAARSKVLIITGGPGVGKTTIVNSILKILMAKQLRCVLCAPTGRAAKRLIEATGCGAKTIHRLLEFDPAKGTFKHNAERPLAADLVLVDEVSMIDLPLAYALLEAIPSQAALILVGDVDQLPSVGPGAVLGDLIASQAIPTVRLTEVFRQAAQSRIVQAAHAVNAGRMPRLDERDSASDFFFVPAEDPEVGVRCVVEVVAERIPRRFGFNPIGDIQVLTPMQRGVLGARHLNQALQARLNPGQDGQAAVERFGYTFRVGDRVLQTANNYGKDVFNGDLGVVAQVEMEESELQVDFDGRKVAYDFGELDELVTAYAMTIHKSQGSEFPAVVIPVHTQHYMMLHRNLLYTGITRGRKLVVVVGTPRAVAIAVKRGEARLRHAALRERLQ
jgi:exodeoxyribonuclease V alpha subunit